MGKRTAPTISFSRAMTRTALQRYTYALELLALARDPAYWRPTYDRLVNLYGRYHVPGVMDKPGVAQLLDMYDCLRVAKHTKVPRRVGQAWREVVLWNEPVVDALLDRFAVSPAPSIECAVRDHMVWLRDQDTDVEFRRQEIDLRNDLTSKRVARLRRRRQEEIEEDRRLEQQELQLQKYVEQYHKEREQPPDVD
ncbi:Uncharacterized protein PBTT_07946 [Plasmodiophora brassicae]|uniref:Uncharacterized protein n=1 Tax=Plasmodiophora brassicae TaxID=37360 RepID=A0A0G4IUC0_PLABS|nr:hypothetical protein PBRA_006946 [Plasmodiophora brassicae]SPR00549.1 unnamed protein product [Plasmodiophora brassicae]